MTFDKMSRMVVGGSIGALIGAASIAPMYMFIASVGMVPASPWRNVFIFAILCLPLLIVGAVAERHEGQDQKKWLRRVVPFCLGSATLAALACAAPALVTNEVKTDASVICFLSFGWMAGMQGGFFLLLFRDEVRRQDEEAEDAATGSIPGRLPPYW